MKTPPYIAYPPFFKFCPTPPSPFPPTLTATAHYVTFFSRLNGWSCHIWCAILLNDIMDVHMSSLKTLMHVSCNNASSLLSSDIWCGFFLYSDLISDIHTHKHTHKDTQHTSGPVDWHTHVSLYLHQVLCAHSSYLYCNKWIIHWYQKLTSHNTFSFQNLFTC